MHYYIISIIFIYLLPLEPVSITFMCLLHISIVEIINIMPIKWLLLLLYLSHVIPTEIYLCNPLINMFTKRYSFSLSVGFLPSSRLYIEECACQYSSEYSRRSSVSLMYVWSPCTCLWDAGNKSAWHASVFSLRSSPQTGGDTFLSNQQSLVNISETQKSIEHVSRIAMHSSVKVYQCSTLTE